MEGRRAGEEAAIASPDLEENSVGTLGGIVGAGFGGVGLKATIAGIF
jgi:hypothetical protein